MKKHNHKSSKILIGSIAVLFLILFIIIRTSIGALIGVFFLSYRIPNLKAFPLLEYGLERDTNGIPKYRSPLFNEGHYDNAPYIDTIFAKDFTLEKFEKINKDMSKKQVTDVLGEPLSYDAFGIRNPDDINQIVMPNDPRAEECWRYSTDGKLVEKGDTSWYSFLVCFKDNKVSEKQVNEFND